MTVLVRGAVICGSLALVGGWDSASAQRRCDRDFIDRINGPGSAFCVTPGDVKAKRQRDRAAARAAGRQIARDIGKQPRAIRAKPKQSDTAVGVIRGKGTVAGAKSAGRRDSDAGRRRAVGPRSAAVKPLRRAFKTYRAERRDFRRAAVRFARTPRYGTFRGLRREFRQFRSARMGFHRAAVRFARRR